MLDIHKPRLHTTVQRRHTHIRSPSRFVKSEIEEIVLGWISNWALIEFSSVSLCDIVCSNVAAYGTKMDGLAWKRLFQRPLLLFCLNINATLRFWSHTARLYGVLISENKGYSPRRGFILAFIPPVQQKGHLQHMLLLQHEFCTNLKVFPFFCFICSSLYGKILIS